MEDKNYETPNMVWAFAQSDIDTKPLLVESIENGKSRFGWSSTEEHNIMHSSSENHSQHLFLKQIKVGDWIVHINTPGYGQCIAARVTSAYGYDDGLKYPYDRVDFRHYFEIDKSSFTLFNRDNKNVLPNVNLSPRGRFQRVYNVKGFIESIKNLRNNKVNLLDGQTREEYHLKEKTDSFLKTLPNIIQEMNKGKKLEKFLEKFFKKIPNVKVKNNGSGWKSDHGADLLLYIEDPLFGYDKQLVVQVKSYIGKVNNKQAVEDIRRAYDEFNKDGGFAGGIIMTTGEVTKELSDAVDKLSEDLLKEGSIERDSKIILMGGEDLAKFILKNSPEMIFNL